MKNFKITLLVFSMLAFIPTIGMEQAPQAPATSFDALPGDVKRIIIPLIASSNISKVAETIRSLNITNKSFHNFISAPNNLISILDGMPYTANAIDLVNVLRKTNMPVIQSSEITAWLEKANKQLVNGRELYRAVRDSDGFETAVQLLANKNIDLNWRQRGEQIHNHSEVEATPLMTAGFYGRAKIFKALLATGANVHAQNAQGETALILAATQGRTDFVKMLLAAGAKINARDKNGKTALFRVVMHSQLPVITELLSQGADPDIPDLQGMSPLIFAKKIESADIVKLLEEASEKWKVKQ